MIQLHPARGLQFINCSWPVARNVAYGAVVSVRQINVEIHPSHIESFETFHPIPYRKFRNIQTVSLGAGLILGPSTLGSLVPGCLEAVRSDLHVCTCCAVDGTYTIVDYHGRSYDVL